MAGLILLTRPSFSVFRNDIIFALSTDTQGSNLFQLKKQCFFNKRYQKCISDYTINRQITVLDSTFFFCFFKTFFFFTQNNSQEYQRSMLGLYVCQSGRESGLFFFLFSFPFSLFSSPFSILVVVVIFFSFFFFLSLFKYKKLYSIKLCWVS